MCVKIEICRVSACWPACSSMMTVGKETAVGRSVGHGLGGGGGAGGLVLGGCVSIRIGMGPTCTVRPAASAVAAIWAASARAAAAAAASVSSCYWRVMK
eukprot:2692617-Pyramimonas_sp.AAC.1